MLIFPTILFGAPMSVILFGIANCDTIKKAKKWLTEQQINFQFHDYRKNGLDEQLIVQFASQINWPDLINKRGTTYRQLSQTEKDNINESNFVSLLCQSPAMIKRPILSMNNKFHLGFNHDQYQAIFSIA